MSDSNESAPRSDVPGCLASQILRRAVSGMLPKNRLRAKRLERLLIFPDADTPHEANLIKDHAAEFGQTFKNARDVERAAAEVKTAA